MSDAQRVVGDLQMDYDTETGQIRRVFDKTLGMEVMGFAAGHEVEINGHGLELKLEKAGEEGPQPAWQCRLRGDWYPGMGMGQRLGVFRQVVVGSACMPWGNHINRRQSMHIRYRLDRETPDTYQCSIPHGAGRRPIQPPLWLDTIGTLCGRTDFFGPETRMLAPHFGGAGPREHVSMEDGLVGDVVGHLWNMFRRTHPGVQAIPGAVYYHADGRWVWITCQRPHVGMHWTWRKDGQTANFEYHARLTPAEIVHTPEVSLYWGKGGKAEMFEVLNEAFIGYEEPPEWWYKTTWYWMHHWQNRARGFEEMGEQMKYLHEKLGLTGFGITMHDVRPGNWDCGAAGLRPSPHRGGEAGFRKLAQSVKGFGGKMFVWLPYLGLGMPGGDLKEHWTIKGENGRAFENFMLDSYDLYQAPNFNHPEVQKYYLDWIERFVTEFGVSGIFWDCGGVPTPADFSPPETRPFQRFPSESMAGGYSFMEKVFAFGQKLTPDFFMWHECLNTDLRGTGFSTHLPHGDFMANLNRWGRKRLVYSRHQPTT